MIGFRVGDLHARWSRRCVEVSKSTTHRAMLRLFTKIFSKYGRVNISPRYHAKLRISFWALNARLDPTFKFLIKKPKHIPSWISRDALLFRYFLGGYFDAEGCIYICKHANRADVTIQIGSTDLELLKDIKNTASKLGYSLKLTLGAPYRRRNRDHGKKNKDYWQLRLYKNEEVTSFLKKLFILHDEKMEKMKLALFVHGKKWDNVKKSWKI